MDKDEFATVEKLKGQENWIMWKFQTKVFLNADDLYGMTIEDKKPVRETYNGDSAEELFN